MRVELRDGDGQELRRRVRAERDALARDRCRAVLLAGEGDAADGGAERSRDQIAAAVGRSRQFVDAWVGRYMNEHLRFIGEAAAPGEHVVLVLDGAGWHTSKALRVPANVTLLHLPPYSPELNPAERPWRTMRQDDLSNRAFADDDDLFEAVKAAWLKLTPERLTSIMATEWLRAG